MSHPNEPLFTVEDVIPVEPVEFAYRLVVYGTPAPQGSKKAFVNRGRAVIVDDNKRTRPWREAVKEAAIIARGADSLLGPVAVSIRFYLPRPASHFGTGRNIGQVKAAAPAYPASVPDIDKLARSTLDALTDSGLIKDDKQIVTLNLTKRYPDMQMDVPGAVIVVELL